MKTRYMRFVQQLREAVLGSSGRTDHETRRAVENHAAILGGRAGSSDELPLELSAFVNKVARHAHMVTREDIDALVRAGYSQDAIFEVTLAGAVGAGLGRLERGLAALDGSV